MYCEVINPLMAKRGRRGRSTKFVVLNNDPTITVGTLADATVKRQDSILTLAQDFHCVSMDIDAQMVAHTAGEGASYFGVAQGELTVTEIKEAVEAQPLHEFDIPAIEHAARKVRLVGGFSGEVADEELAKEGTVRVKLNWRVPSGKNLPVVFLLNRSSEPWTTGTLIKNQLKYYGYWK